jgi:hypothetical protein
VIHDVVGLILLALRICRWLLFDKRLEQLVNVYLVYKSGHEFGAKVPALVYVPHKFLNPFKFSLYKILSFWQKIAHHYV